MEVRSDFPLLKQDIVYFDNSATTLKPEIVIKTITDYYTNYTANAYRGDYDNSLKVDNKIKEVREKVKAFINAPSEREIIFTSGGTAAFNLVVNGFFKYYLRSGDEILITKSEHASLALPWFELAKQVGCQVKYIELAKDLTVTLEQVKKAVTKQTKVIALAHITNVIGDIRPIKAITTYAHQQGIYVVVDGAQSVPHLPVDVQALDVDFLTFAGHKMLGPTGIGVLYGKPELLKQVKPTIVGGGMNTDFTSAGTVSYKELPYRLEGGTPHIAGIIGLGAAISYLEQIGLEKIKNHEQDLKAYAVSKLKQLPNLELYNEHTKTGIIAFNVKDVFSQDTALYLNKNKVCIRAGNHCAKMLREDLKVKNVCRLSFYLYNTKAEIDYLVELLAKDNIIKEALW